METIKKHPEGLKVLFFTEMWERMSYYGMRGLLILFMTAGISEGGLNFDNISASAIYGIYASSVYLATLPGGWFADRVIGQQKAIFYGGIIIIFGHLSLIISNLTFFYLGLSLIVIGTGLLKPNISAIVGELYEKNDSLKDAGFTIFYMAINLGSILGFFICGYLGENIGWHYGFAASGVGMTFGLIQYYCYRNKLNGIGSSPEKSLEEKTIKIIKIAIPLLTVITLSIIIFCFYNNFYISASYIANSMTLGIVLITFAFFLYIFFFGRLSKIEKKKVFLISILFIGAALFWAGFDQAGTSFNIFAKEYTDRVIYGWEYPASWLQILNPLFVVLLSPFIAYFWIFLGKRMIEPYLTIKFGIGLIFMALGFFTITFGAYSALEYGQTGAKWLLLTYLFHTIGELTISPVGLSAISKLSPKRFLGQMMGIWFLASSLGAIIAGILSGEATQEGLQTMPSLFNDIALWSMLFGIIFIILTIPMRKFISQNEIN